MNQTPVPAKLQGVFSTRPCDIVDDLLNRYSNLGGSSEGNLIRQIPHAHVGIRVLTSGSHPLTHKAITEIVNYLRRNDGGVPGKDSFAIVIARFRRRLARKLRCVGNAVVHQIAPHKNPMIPIAGDIEIHSCHIGVQIGRLRGSKCVPQHVKSIGSDRCGRVSVRIGGNSFAVWERRLTIPEGQDRRICSTTQGAGVYQRWSWVGAIGVQS